MKRNKNGWLITVKVTPHSKEDQVIKCEQTGVFKVKVKAPASEGKANKALIDLLAKTLGVPKSSLEITRGLTSHNKTVLVKTT